MIEVAENILKLYESRTLKGKITNWHITKKVCMIGSLAPNIKGARVFVPIILNGSGDMIKLKIDFRHIPGEIKDVERAISQWSWQAYSDKVIVDFYNEGNALLYFDEEGKMINTDYQTISFKLNKVDHIIKINFSKITQNSDTNFVMMNAQDGGWSLKGFQR